jgi:hypothetical protein
LIISACNYGAQATSCLAALVSLQRQQQFLSPDIFIALEFVGFFAVGYVSACSGASSKLRAIYGEGRAEGYAAGRAAGEAARRAAGEGVARALDDETPR